MVLWMWRGEGSFVCAESNFASNMTFDFGTCSWASNPKPYESERSQVSTKPTLNDTNCRRACLCVGFVLFVIV